jgi:hypothetical protein
VVAGWYKRSAFDVSISLVLLLVVLSGCDANEAQEESSAASGSSPTTSTSPSSPGATNPPSTTDPSSTRRLPPPGGPTVGSMQGPPTTAAPLPLLLLKVEVKGAGIVTSDPAGIRCPSRCVGGFRIGSQIDLKAASGINGYVFLRWSGCRNNRAGSQLCKILLASDTAVTAIYALAATP